MKTMGERLAQALEARNMEPPELIAAIGRSKGAVYNILKDVTRPEKVWAMTASAICRALRIRQRWLLEGVGPMEGTEEGDGTVDREILARAIIVARKEIIATHRKLTVKQEAAVVAYAYKLLTDGMAERAAAEVVRGMLDAFSLSPVKST